ncbi:MAG: hypothetical protein ACKO5C_00975 [Ferruginibacter sp.]
MARSAHIIGRFGLLGLALSTLLLTGCPFGSPYPLDDNPPMAIQDTLLGRWRTHILNEYGKSIPITMLLEKYTDSIYNITFSGFFSNPVRTIKKKAVEDTISSLAFESTVEGHSFWNVAMGDKIYPVLFQYQDDHISLKPMNDHFSSFIIKSGAQLRERLTYHIRMRKKLDLDESFQLIRMTRVTDP